MPDYFRFRADSPYVLAGLTQQEINGVQTWQNQTLDYEFSFHTQHEAGHPCYLAEPDGPRRNLPKLNVKEGSRLEMLQQGSIRSQACGDDFEAVIRANLALFRKLAGAYYAEAVRKQTAAKWVVDYCCAKQRGKAVLRYLFPEDLAARVQTDGNRIEYAQLLWPNFKARSGSLYRKPSCPQHKNTDCIAEVLTLLPANSREKLAGYIEDDGGLVAY